MAMTWKATYETKITEIDEQHKNLITIGNEIFSIAKEMDIETKQTHLLEALAKLKQYTIDHFDYEEKLLLDSNYPFFTVHKEEHEAFKEKLHTFELTCHSSEVNFDTYFQMIEFLICWVTEHILASDHKYIPFVTK